MEFGNYGYVDELTGAGWRDVRTGWREEIPERHWHLNDPGVVPNLLQTGAGSRPVSASTRATCSPKSSRARSFTAMPAQTSSAPIRFNPTAPVTRRKPSSILDGSLNNKWFRPSDVCVAPDGSLLVADWYDPGVGGHRMQDAEHGRHLSVSSPPTTTVRGPFPNRTFQRPTGAVVKRSSPLTTPLATWPGRPCTTWARTRFRRSRKLFDSDNPRHRARALGVLSKSWNCQPPDRLVEFLGRRVCSMTTSTSECRDASDPATAGSRSILKTSRRLMHDAGPRSAHRESPSVARC